MHEELSELRLTEIALETVHATCAICGHEFSYAEDGGGFDHAEVHRARGDLPFGNPPTRTEGGPDYIVTPDEGWYLPVFLTVHE